MFRRERVPDGADRRKRQVTPPPPAGPRPDATLYGAKADPSKLRTCVEICRAQKRKSRNRGGFDLLDSSSQCNNTKRCRVSHPPRADSEPDLLHDAQGEEDEEEAEGNREDTDETHNAIGLVPGINFLLPGAFRYDEELDRFMQNDDRYPDQKPPE